MKRLSLSLFCLALFLAHALPAPSARAQQAQQSHFIVLAPDRGFLGNEETRDVFAAFRKHVPMSALVFATHEQTDANIEEALSTLPSDDNVVVLPLFLSSHHALYRKAQAALTGLEDVSIEVAEPFGQSYLAEEILFDRVEALSDTPETEALVVLAYGAETPEEAQGLREDLQPLAERARKKYGLSDASVTVHYARSASSDVSREAFGESIQHVKSAASQHERVLVVPFNLGMRYTAMMSDWHWTAQRLDAVEGVVKNGESVLPHPNAERWLRRTANAYRPIARDQIGVIVIPHGSDYHWNEQMRKSIAPLTQEYNIEEAFSMVDPVVVERAVRRLEEEGMRAAVVVRIFSLEANFRDKAEYVLGLRSTYEGGFGGAFPPRIESHMRFATLGGLEADPLFARALLDRAESLSTNPAEETVILLAHGTGSDARNQHWLNNLQTIADTMRARGGDAFRDIKHHTWREDWPDKRKESIPAIRRMVQQASEDGGTAIVIPARTTAQGPAEEYLDDLNYRYGQGFAPHPLFLEWLREQIETGIARLGNASDYVSQHQP